ncbi:MAG: ArsR/SmtB family transcription factor [Promethearchaeia archaeon]
MKAKRKQEIINSLKMCADLSDKDLESYFENLRQRGKEIAENKMLDSLGKFFNILGNDTRLRILKLLNQKDFCVCELEAILDKSQSSISHHLRLLEGMGLIQGIKRGYFTHYQILSEKFKDFLTSFYEQFHCIAKNQNK